MIYTVVRCRKKENKEDNDMFNINEGIEVGLKHLNCPNCNKELSIVLGGLFGKNIDIVNKYNIKYISGCCFENEYFYCDYCKKYYNKLLTEI